MQIQHDRAAASSDDRLSLIFYHGTLNKHRRSRRRRRRRHRGRFTDSPTTIWHVRQCSAPVVQVRYDACERAFESFQGRMVQGEDGVARPSGSRKWRGRKLRGVRENRLCAGRTVVSGDFQLKNCLGKCNSSILLYSEDSIMLNC